MSEPSASPAQSHGNDMHEDKEHAEEQSLTPPVLSPAEGPPPSSASEVLRPLSQVTGQWSVPVPTSGSLASLARQKGQQQLGSLHRTMQDDTPPSESPADATADSYSFAAIQEFTAAAWQPVSHEEHGDKPVARISPDSDDGKKSPEALHSPYSSIYTDGIDPYTLFVHRFDEPRDGIRKSIQKSTESVQLFRRREDDNGQIWRRRVTEYR